MLPFFHIYGMVVLMNLSFRFNATIVVYPKFDPASYLAGIGTYKVTTAHVAPPILGFLAKHPVVAKFNLSPLREIFSAAAPLGEDLARACQKRYASRDVNACVIRARMRDKPCTCTILGHRHSTWHRLGPYKKFVPIL